MELRTISNYLNHFPAFPMQWWQPVGDTPILVVLLLVALAVIVFLLIRHRGLRNQLDQLTARVRGLGRAGFDSESTADQYRSIPGLAQAVDEMAGEIRERINALETERSQLQAILEHLNDGVLIVNTRGALVLINRAAEQLLAIERDRALVRSYTEVVRDHELVELIRESPRIDITSEELPHRFIELGWPRRSVQAFAYSISRDDMELVIVLLRDITELRRTEMVRRDFVANVSHDLRTPVASLKALVDTLLEGALEDESVARDFLLRMEVEVDDLARLLEELLELSRAESRRIELQQVPVDVSILVDRCVSRLGAQADSRGIKVSTEIPRELPRAWIDPERIEQVVVNLLDNAIKFSPENGTIAVQACHVGDMIRVAIADHGLGIPADEQDRVFERFYKSDHSRSNVGSGLGLAIARHLVQLHGGRIWVDRDYRDGARFAFTMPAAPSPTIEEET